MFGDQAPIWDYLQAFGGPSDPLCSFASGIFETYPVLTAIALKWTHTQGQWGRLPKYNPARKKTFLLSDWKHVCESAAVLFAKLELLQVAQWLKDAYRRGEPCKADQDGVDACLCLVTALYLAEGKECLIVGDQQTGYIVVPHDADLLAELNARSTAIGRIPADWVQRFRWARETLLM
jgi:predicted RNase H-like nuclease